MLAAVHGAGIPHLTYSLATQDDMNVTVKEVETLGRRTLACIVDVRPQEPLDAAVAAGIDEYGHIDILIANAGIWAWGPFWEIAEQAWDDMLGITAPAQDHAVAVDGGLDDARSVRRQQVRMYTGRFGHRQPRLKRVRDRRERCFGRSQCQIARCSPSVRGSDRSESSASGTPGTRGRLPGVLHRGRALGNRIGHVERRPVQRWVSATSLKAGTEDATGSAAAQRH